MEEQAAREAPEHGAADPIALCVDLDGTIIDTDVVLELCLRLVRRNPLYLLALGWWLLRGRAYLKTRLTERATLAIEALPYRASVVAYLHEQHRAGRRILLVTGAPIKIAREVAAHLGCFAEVAGTEGTLNLKGRNKRDFLVERFKAGGFDFIGNDMADLPCLREARVAMVAGASWSLRRAERRGSFNAARSFAERRLTPGCVLEQIRVRQWAKNLLVFLPLILAHRVAEPHRLLNALGIFVAFGLAASCGYLLNDLLDLEADRMHPSKRLRPLAMGRFPVKLAAQLAAGLALGAALVAAVLPPATGLFLALYVLGTLSYSLYLKRLLLIDVLVLAALYTVRIFAGGAAAMVPVSSWLATFAMFFFLSLALLKRYSEIKFAPDGGRLGENRRGYLIGDLEQIRVFGSASGFMAALVFVLYVDSQEVRVLYSRPQVLGLIAVLLIYWICRVWILAERGEVTEDPLLFALRDKVSYVLGLLIAAILLAAL